MSDPKPLWTTKQTATYYQVTERTVRNWIDKGALDVERKGRTVRILPPRATGTSTTTA